MEIVVIGAGGRLGAALMREYRRKFDVIGFDRAQLDLSNRDQIRERIDAASFDVLINAAAFTNVDLCETQRDRAFYINAEAPRVLAEICRDKDAKLIHFSTDYVFDGEKREPYTEEDEAHPISVYGESKRAGEENVLAVKGRHLVVRVNVGPVAGGDDPGGARDHAETGVTAPGYSASDYSGILHFANAGQCSWQEYGQWALDCCEAFGVPIKAKTVDALELKDMTRLRQGYGGQANWMAPRPVYSVLSSARYTELTGASPRTWRDAVADYIRRFYSKK